MLLVSGWKVSCLLEDKGLTVNQQALSKKEGGNFPIIIMEGEPCDPNIHSCGYCRI
ncbi:hypothetical protein Tco_1129273, partial [Tanacetum coccineum]